MSTYFCSDIHGEYDLFRKLLEKVAFSASDKLYVLGDLIDKGKDSAKLVEFMRSTPNAYVVVGNHEYMFLEYYRSAYEETNGDAERLNEKLTAYYPTGATPFSAEQIAYLYSLPFYVEGKTFYGVHAGVSLDETGRVIPMERQNKNVLLFDRRFKSENVRPEGNKTIFFGHTPCSYDNGTGEIVKTLRSGVKKAVRFTDYAKIRLDTGVAVTGMLGLFRANDMAEFYVKK